MGDSVGHIHRVDWSRGADVQAGRMRKRQRVCPARKVARAEAGEPTESTSHPPVPERLPLSLTSLP